MKVELKGTDFTPVQITIETQEELDVLMTSLCHTTFACDSYEDISEDMVISFNKLCMDYNSDIPRLG